MNYKKLTILLSILLVFLSISLIYLFVKNNNEKLGFIDLNKVLADFKLKQELEKKLTGITQTHQMIIDSLEFELKLLSKQLQSGDSKDKNKINLFEVKREEYYEKKKKFDEESTAVAKNYDDQIYTQLNQYVKDYGAKYGYSYILGADGSGSLMYAKETGNITEEVKKFINERYTGETK